MSAVGWLQIGVFAGLVLALTPPLGAWMYRVFEAPAPPLPRTLGRIERLLLRACGVDARVEMTWSGYALALLCFSLVGILVSYALLRLQHLLPLNPQGFPGVDPALAFNTSISFVTNTDWQSYAGESTLSHASQMAALAWHNFTSAATGIGVALAMARGLTRRGGVSGPRTLGNFWVDLIRATVYVLLPGSLLTALLLIAMGSVQTFAPDRSIAGLEGVKQLIALGPVASQEAIKMLGTNGGGFFNANSAHPFENPSPLANLLQIVLIFAIPAGLTFTYGRMARDARQGWAIFAAMAILFLAGVALCYHAESRPNPAFAGLPVDSQSGNLEGKETRFGVAGSALFATVTTDASCGAVNAMHDSFTPLGGLVPLVNIQLGEVIFGGAGAGLYGILVFVLLAVFIAGLMVGRTPEYLGKKVEAREIQLAMLYVLIFPLIILGFSAVAAVTPYGISALGNSGPHGLSEILYAFSSAAGNNGSAFGGLNANSRFWNVALGLAMLAGRFLMIVPVLGIAGSMVGKKLSAAGPGTFPTDGWLFTGLLVGVVIILGALTFFPALALGPLVEHYLARAGRVY